MTEFINRVRRNREFVNYARNKISCVKCGSDVNKQFHHCKFAYKKLMSINKVVRRKVSIDDVIKELNKCTVLCEDCHKDIHMHGYIDNTKPINFGLIYMDWLIEKVKESLNVRK